MEQHNELYHHGVPGMKWGVRRSREKLGRKVGKMRSKNSELSDKVKRLNDAAKKYDVKSTKMIKRNAKYEARIAKATPKQAKYEIKLQKELSKRNPNAEKVGKLTAKKQKYDTQITKATSKLKFNKWNQKASEAREAAAKAQAKIEKNERLMKKYNNTIKALDAGTIQQGRLFMQYVTE